MTYIELVNAVLRKLREVEVTSVSESTYSKLIGEFVNEAKEEVEDSWDWSHLRRDLDINTQAGVFTYTLTNGFGGEGERYSILQALNVTRDSIVKRASYAWIKRQLLLGTTGEGSPGWYSINGSDSNNSPFIQLFPVPNAVETLTFNVVVRQKELASDIDVLKVPSSPVVLGAYFRAVKERGEDQEDGSNQAAADYARVWNTAVARDVALQEEETTWQVV